jgi:hypothetical protein
VEAARKDRAQRLLVALAAAALVTLLVWGLWMIVAFVFGATGWALSSVGNLLQTIMNGMTSVRGVVFWIALGSGAVLGGLLGFNVSLDRLRNRFRRARPVGENP